MTALEIIRAIIAERREGHRVPELAPHVEVLKRYREANGSTEPINIELAELKEWGMISEHPTSGGCSYSITD